MQQGYTYDPIQRQDVSTIMDAILYSQQRIGSPIPIGVKRRSLVVKRISEELEVQRWGVEHLVAAVDFMKSSGIRAKSFDYVLYHVEPAVKSGHLPREQISTWDGLASQVAEAIAVEDDDEWVRRLCSAQGKALLRVYQLWEMERKENV